APALVAKYWLTVASLGLYASRRDSYDAAKRAADAFRALGDAPRLFDALIKTAVQGTRFGSIEEMGAAISEAEGLVGLDLPLPHLPRLEFARYRWFARQGRIEESLAAAERQAAAARACGNELGALYAMSNVVAAENQLGRNEIALDHARQAIARLEVLGASGGSGHLWLGVAIAEILCGRVNEALAACRTTYALLLREDDQLRVFRVCALCAALRGRLEDAARIVGFADAAYVQSGALRELRWTNLSERLEQLFAAALSAEARTRLYAEGAVMREEDAIRMGLGDAA
ncbi:MAG: hypothetical protein ABIO63_02565, partial [Casimicrobiaceae bacterium]